MSAAPEARKPAAAILSPPSQRALIHHERRATVASDLVLDDVA
jgi:hypothetical protein